MPFLSRLGRLNCVSVSLDSMTTFVAGLPPISEGTSFPASELVLAQRGISSYLLVPCDIAEDKKITDVILSFNIDMIQEKRDIPSILFFTTERPTISVDVNNDLSPSIFEQLLQYSSRVTEIIQALNLQKTVEQILEGIPGFGDLLHETKGGVLSSLSKVIAGRLAGYASTFPQVWRGTTVSREYSFNINHQVWLSEDPVQETRDFLSCFGRFVFPRSLGSKDESHVSESIQTIGSKSGSEAQQDEITHFWHLMFKFPYFCKLLDARTGETLVNVGMVDTGSIKLDPGDSLWSGTPAVLRVSFSVKPLLPIIINTGQEQSSGNVTTMDEWIQAVSGSTGRVSSPFIDARGDI